jgi:hypothetical protein
LTKKQQVKKKSTWSWEPINPVDNSPLFDWPPSVGKVLTWAKKNYFSISIRMFVILLALATWLIATPALESCREFSLGWITYIYVRNLVLIVIIAGGLLSKIKTSYFRIGHMGSVSSSDVIAVLAALERSLFELGHNIVPGESLEAFQNELLQTEVKSVTNNHFTIIDYDL